MRKQVLLIMLLAIVVQACAVRVVEASVSQARAVVMSVEPGLGLDEDMQEQIATLRVLDGPHEGRELRVTHRPLRHSVRDFQLRAGHRVIVSLSEDAAGRLAVHSLRISRSEYLLMLAVVFAAATLIFGLGKGLASLLALGFSGLVVVKILLPAILSGHSPIVASVSSAILIIVVGFLLISGFTRKTTAAILGTTGGAVTAGLLARYFVDITAITGTAEDDVGFLITELGASINYEGIFLAGILIGTIGVVMDVAMSISSVIFELKAKSPRISVGGLIRSGLSVGRDVMATMVNTLILAYAGTSIPLFLMFHYTDFGYSAALNAETVAGEVIRALCGSIGLIMTIPLTVTSATFLACGHRNSRRSRRAKRHSV